MVYDFIIHADHSRLERALGATRGTLISWPDDKAKAFAVAGESRKGSGARPRQLHQGQRVDGEIALIGARLEDLGRLTYWRRKKGFKFNWKLQTTCAPCEK